MNNYSTGDPEKDAAIQAAISAFKSAYQNYKTEDEKTNKWIDYLGKLNSFNLSLSNYTTACIGAMSAFSSGVRFDDGSFLGNIELKSLSSISSHVSQVSTAIAETEKRIMQMRVVVYNAWKKAVDAYRNITYIIKTNYPMPSGFSLNWTAGEYDGIINTF